MNDQEVVIGGGQSISVDSLVAKRDLVTEIVRDWEIGREKQKELE